MRTELGLSLALTMLLSYVVGCSDERRSRPPHDGKARPAEQGGAEAKQNTKPLPPARKVELANNLFLEIQGEERRVLLTAEVCLRQGQLEQFLTRKRTKEHESILAADVDASKVHAALVAAGAEPGKPVQFDPKFRPASGTVIKVAVEYQGKNGNVVRVPAQQWVRHSRTKKDLAYDWVFAGSHLFEDPLDKTRPPYYTANDGDVICLSNFPTAMLDLPIESVSDNDALFFEAHTERIPELQTPVTVILQPLPAKKK